MRKLLQALGFLGRSHEEHVMGQVCERALAIAQRQMFDAAVDLAKALGGKVPLV